MLNRLIKRFAFEESIRNEMVFSDPNKIRMNPRRELSTGIPGVELKLTTGYPTDPWLFVRTPITTPNGVQKWIGFDEEVDKPDNTDVLYRFGSVIPGGGEEIYYNDGGAWRIAVDSVQSTGTITVVDFSLIAGLTYSINSFIRTEGEQWTASVDNDTTAQSIADDINTFANVTATVVGAVITITAVDSGVSGDLITLATTGGLNLVASGATLTGGIDAEFNTVQEIRDNIDTLLDFVVNTRSGDKTIFVHANPKTTDPKVSPLVKEIKLLGLYEVEWMEDIKFDTMRNDMHDKIRFSFDLELEMPVATDTIDLTTDSFAPDNAGYNIMSIESVYDMSVDPERLNDLLLSYAPGSAKIDGETFDNGVITLSSAVPLGNIIWIKALVVPEIAVNTDQDFFEVKNYPCIVYDKIKEMSSRTTLKYTSGSGKDFVRDIANGTAVEVQPPAVQDLRFDFSVYTSNQIDQSRLMSAMQEYFNENVVINTNALDEPVTMILVDEYVEEEEPDLDDTNTGSGAFVLRSVPFFLKKSLDVPLVLAVKTDFRVQVES